MSNVLTPEPQAPAASAERFANPLRQMGGLLAQPAVRRSLPMVLMVGLVAAAALAWVMMATPPQRILFSNVSDADKAAISDALTTAGISSSIDGSGSITVAEDEFHKARMLLASQDLPKAAPGGYAILDQLPMGVSRAVEGERLRQARETELARSIQEIDSVAEARVHLATPEASVFVRDNPGPSASVIVRLQPGRSLSDAQVRSVVNLVASSVPGMKPDAVTIVDQMGALLSKSKDGSGGSDISDARIDYQRRLEEKYRAQLNALLTPLVGAGNFTTEVQAEVDLDESQATRESFEKQGVVRAEQGNWTGIDKEQTTPPGGIPGALSNTPPAAATLAQNGQPGANGQPAVPGAAPNAAAPQLPPLQKQSDSFTRTYDLGKEISVTRATPGSIRRLSVAVLLRDPDGKPRSRVEIQQITDLVRATVGYNAVRQDQVTVVSRKFSPEPAPELVKEQPWYDSEWVAIAARNGTAVLIALLVLFLGVRPLSKALLKKREDAGAASADRPGLALAGPGGATGVPEVAAGVSLEMLDRARSYEDRVGLVKGFTRDNPARAALAVRDMIKADNPS